MLSAVSAAGGLLASVRFADAFLDETWLPGVVDESFAGAVVLAIVSSFIISNRTDPGPQPVAAVGALLEALRPRLGAQGILSGVLRELMRLTGAREVVVALENLTSGRLLLFNLAAASDDDAVLTIPHPAARSRSMYFFAWPPDPNEANDAHVLSGDEVRVGTEDEVRGWLPLQFETAHPFRNLYAVAFTCGDEWRGRMFLLDPQPLGPRTAFVKTFEVMLRQLIPSVASRCDLRAIRRRAADQERARLGRELHDGAVQGLLSIDLELELLRRRSRHDSAEVAESIGRVQERLHREIASLRQLLERARSHDVDSCRLPDAIGDIVERFSRETGVAAEHLSTIGTVCLPTRVCGEIVRIVQEALVNVRRHSGARRVRVELAATADALTLTIEDDGRGFRMLSASQSLSNIRPVRPPAVINERVHSIGGRVRVEAPAAGGARLEITLPRNGPWTASA